MYLFQGFFYLWGRVGAYFLLWKRFGYYMIGFLKALDLLKKFFFLGSCLLMIRLAAMDPISINFLERKWNSRHSCRSPVPTTRNAPTAINASSTIQTEWPTKKVSRKNWSLNPPNVSMRCGLEKFTHAIHHQVCI